TWCEQVPQVRDQLRGEEVRPLGHAPLARRAAEVVDPEDEVGAAHAVDSVVPVAQADQGAGREMRPGGFAPDHEMRRPELALAVLEEPQGGGFAVVGS